MHQLDKPLTHPDFVDLSDELTVKYTPAGLRVFSQIYREYGIPLPLPEQKAVFDAWLWRILDEQAAEIARELSTGQAAGLAGGEYGQAWLAGDSGRRAAAAESMRAALEAREVEQRGLNIVSLDWRREMAGPTDT